MFYKIIRPIARFIVWLLNGRTKIIDKDKLPEGSYVLVAPHRTWWEPIIFALAASPKEFSFMAKKELFKNPILGWILRHAHAFPVDRFNPGPSAIKTPVRTLKEGQLSLIMFPSGTRYSAELKGGAALIAKLAKVPLLPAVYQGPTTFKGFLKHQNVTIGFGDPIMVDRRLKLDEAGADQVNQQMEAAWQAIDQKIDPNFKYQPDQKKLDQEKSENKFK
ncbi:1-acyl-sn-glycerol-3-phosphate acyltransferase [Lapidilactobacillus dextrinicus DSM 20335]|uniref:1-acyl-sn-glycerol-3-phosphate acyltransferase n=1 Tax=Lapidilactobacillus dextrinicus DSM 20335 TaxID=1423738 RepID=A0A0R2BKE9_9LACO|nr:lysophospholipid acyltransferase family protein [Lapidilactobacillus dextrinicus]KRM79722.1 1-acyl-sn-glycerol-3-phosphate acyltransferase [Lapidilactobacillus dextrinicus DSM 20335]QFG47046.1 1-acyl-sn-glycerol-3-phosphate acyltransferase [Lapidilactobacillus dextrinicus]